MNYYDVRALKIRAANANKVKLVSRPSSGSAGGVSGISLSDDKSRTTRVSIPIGNGFTKVFI